MSRPNGSTGMPMRTDPSSNSFYGMQPRNEVAFKVQFNNILYYFQICSEDRSQMEL